MKIKEIKEQAKIGLKGNFFKAVFITIFYTVIYLLTKFLINSLTQAFLGLNLNILLYILTILINLAILPFSYGVIVSLIGIFKGEKISYTDFINFSLLNYMKIIKLFLSIFIRILPYITILVVTLILANTNFENPIINIFTAILFLASIVVLFIVALNYALTLFVNYDNPTASCKEILEKSKSLIKNNKLKYLLLVLSFILYFVIIVLINNILMYFIESTTIINNISNILVAVITPIITISQYIFYDNLANEKH